MEYGSRNEIHPQQNGQRCLLWVAIGRHATLASGNVTKLRRKLHRKYLWCLCQGFHSSRTLYGYRRVARRGNRCRWSRLYSETKLLRHFPERQLHVAPRWSRSQQPHLTIFTLHLSPVVLGTQPCEVSSQRLLLSMWQSRLEAFLRKQYHPHCRDEI